MFRLLSYSLYFLAVKVCTCHHCSKWPLWHHFWCFFFYVVKVRQHMAWPRGHGMTMAQGPCRSGPSPHQGLHLHHIGELLGQAAEADHSVLRPRFPRWSLAKRRIWLDPLQPRRWRSPGCTTPQHFQHVNYFYFKSCPDLAGFVKYIKYLKYVVRITS